MPKCAYSDGAAALPNRQPRSSTTSSTGSNRTPVRVTGDVVDVDTNDWSEFVRENMLLVDKTDLLLDIMKYDSSDIILRPYRFGKSMFLNMACDFFKVAGTDEGLAEKKRIFKRMNVHRVDPTFVDEHCGRYPVIHLHLKYVQSATWDGFRDSMEQIIATIIDKWWHAISDTSKAELNDSRNRLNQMKSNMYNSVDDGIAILRELVDYLSEYYNAQCIVLVDNFDAPIMKAADHIHGRVKRYVRRLLSPLAEDNTSVRKFIMVGIDPVNLDTFGPGMNNCRRYPLHEHSDRSREDVSLYQTSFGFTKEEVEALLDKAAVKWGLTTEQGDHLRRVAQRWYDGYYVCRDMRIYNPLSIMCLMEHITKSRKKCLEVVESGSASRYWLSEDISTFSRLVRDVVGGAMVLLPVVKDLVADFLNLVGTADKSASNYVPRVRVRIEDCTHTTKLGGVGSLPSRFTTTSGDRQQWVVSITSSVQGKPAKDSLDVNELMTLLYYHGYLSIKDRAYLTIPNYEALCAWLGLIDVDHSVNRLVSGMGGKPVLVDHLLSGEYLKFIEHVERVLEVQNRKRDAIQTYEPSFRILASLMLSLSLDSSKYDVAREITISQGRFDIVVKPRRGVINDGDRGPLGVLIEVKQAGPNAVDRKAHPLTGIDARFIKNKSKDRMRRARRKLGAKTFRSLAGLLAEGYDQVLEKQHLDTFNGCCGEVLVVVVSLCGTSPLFRFDYFGRQGEVWCLEPKKRSIIDHLSCPFNWPDL
ncbi:hypothetical protein EV182_000295 [Spiromyces aspiralis]|uniref:Uncharacterized protein n=1 Tax=Spiromyces aspiralis TaxID=68401 RepID=A0ACC1HHU9_9FUNG|nr:hypothetical protein EV182_000295 [Spiromyces aspiralis]